MKLQTLIYLLLSKENNTFKIQSLSKAHIYRNHMLPAGLSYKMTVALICLISFYQIAILFYLRIWVIKKLLCHFKPFFATNSM